MEAAPICTLLSFIFIVALLASCNNKESLLEREKQKGFNDQKNQKHRTNRLFGL
ncbi:hypothetical protein [Salicibibacter halophilus]|uniref:hypothetical protein n=1 Tax=Salicibibacter halophilus TaxID=2502791 RepID=UPI0013567623|nr:hypothetical protein [Salicibibacter halophilus]